MTAAAARMARRAMLASLLMSLPPPRARAQDFFAQPLVRPPPRLETVPPSPGRSYEWAPGFWRWDGTRFTWTRGRYIQRRPWSYRWIKGHFESGGGTEKWVPGFFGGPRPKQNLGP